jgi:hypothetical protein
MITEQWTDVEKGWAFLEEKFYKMARVIEEADMSESTGDMMNSFDMNDKSNAFTCGPVSISGFSRPPQVCVSIVYWAETARGRALQKVQVIVERVLRQNGGPSTHGAAKPADAD